MFVIIKSQQRKNFIDNGTIKKAQNTVLATRRKQRHDVDQAE